MDYFLIQWTFADTYHSWDTHVWFMTIKATRTVTPNWGYLATHVAKYMSFHFRSEVHVIYWAISIYLSLRGGAQAVLTDKTVSGGRAAHMAKTVYKHVNLTH
jgi:hypothetical protein